MSEMIASELTVRPTAASFSEYIRARVDGYDSLTADEVVELTFAFHSEWQSSDERKAERENAKAEREIAAAKKRAEREEARKARLEAERAALEAKLAKLSK